jgi:hypothetical protein
MTITEVRQKLQQQIEQLPSEQLALVLQFLESLPVQTSTEQDPSSEEPALAGSTVADLLKFAGTWQGDDFEDCLQAVYDDRLPAEF